MDDVKETMSKIRHRDFPILDEQRHLVGMMSRRNLLNMKKKQLILVDHNERTQAVDGIEQADILEIIDHHRLGSLETISPIFFRNQPLGCTATDHLSDVSGKGRGDQFADRRTFVLCYPFRYPDVPITDLHRYRQDGSRAVGADRRGRCGRIGDRHV